MKLKFRKINLVPFIIILGICSFFLPYLIIIGTKILEKKQYIWLMYFELIACLTIFLIWYKIYNEVIFAKVKNNILFYRRFFFIKKSIKIEDIKGYKEVSEESDFLVLYDKQDKKIFVIRLDFYENFYDFIEALHVKKIGNYTTLFQKIILKIFRRKNF
nr:hypothetical protein [uncultured Chryseobacterium sp.]